jgi:hypothetical protein
MVASTKTETSPSTWKATDTAVATRARARDVKAVSATEAAALSPMTEPGRREAR